MKLTTEVNISQIRAIDIADDLVPVNATRQLEDQLVILSNMAILTGLQKGELLALQWTDIDFENDEVHITNAIRKVGHTQIVKSAQSKKSNRIVAIPHFL